MVSSSFISILTFVSLVACASVPDAPTVNLQLTGKSIYLTTFGGHARNPAALTGTKIAFASGQIAANTPVVGLLQSLNLSCSNGACIWTTDASNMKFLENPIRPGEFIITRDKSVIPKSKNPGTFCAHVDSAKNFYVHLGNDDLTNCASFVVVDSST